MKPTTLLLVLGALLLYACKQAPKPTGSESGYYNSTQLLQAQIKALQAHKAAAYKRVEADGQRDSLLAHPDWKKELQPFMDLELHLGQYKGRYQTATTVLPSGQKRVRYQATDPKLDIRWMEVTLLDTIPQLIEAQYQQENFLFEVEKRYRLQFNAHGDLQGYGLRFMQQMPFSRHNHYAVEGHVRP